MLPQAALFIDGENIASSHAASIVGHLRNRFRLTVARVYGDMTGGTGSAWKEPARALGLRAVHQANVLKGKNLTDSALMLDAYRLLIENPHRFALFAVASGDTDFVPLLQRLREGGVEVALFSQHAVQPFVSSLCDEVVILDDAAARKECAAATAAPTPAAAPEVVSAPAPKTATKAAPAPAPKAGTDGDAGVVACLQEMPKIAPSTSYGKMKIWHGTLSEADAAFVFSSARSEEIVAKNPAMKWHLHPLLDGSDQRFPEHPRHVLLENYRTDRMNMPDGRPSPGSVNLPLRNAVLFPEQWDRARLPARVPLRPVGPGVFVDPSVCCLLDVDGCNFAILCSRVFAVWHAGVLLHHGEPRPVPHDLSAASVRTFPLPAPGTAVRTKLAADGARLMSKLLGRQRVDAHPSDVWAAPGPIAEVLGRIDKVVNRLFELPAGAGTEDIARRLAALAHAREQAQEARARPATCPAAPEGWEEPPLRRAAAPVGGMPPVHGPAVVGWGGRLTFSLAQARALVEQGSPLAPHLRALVTSEWARTGRERRVARLDRLAEKELQALRRDPGVDAELARISGLRAGSVSPAVRDLAGLPQRFVRDDCPNCANLLFPCDWDLDLTASHAPFAVFERGSVFIAPALIMGGPVSYGHIGMLCSELFGLWLRHVGGGKTDLATMKQAVFTFPVVSREKSFVQAVAAAARSLLDMRGKVMKDQGVTAVAACADARVQEAFARLDREVLECYGLAAVPGGERARTLAWMLHQAAGGAVLPLDSGRRPE